MVYQLLSGWASKTVEKNNTVHQQMVMYTPEYINWVWNYCESRQRLTHYDYMALVYELLRECVKLKDKKYFYSDGRGGTIGWKACNSGHIKYLLATCLLELKELLRIKARENDLVVPSSWCKSRFDIISDASLTKILRLCKERFQDDFVPISQAPPHPSTPNAVPGFTYHIQEVYL